VRKDRVTPEVRREVLLRDGRCFASIRYETHVCRDVYGAFHDATDLDRLTLDHVHDVAGGVRGKRAPSDPQHLVAVCGYLNVYGPSREMRQQQRDYLRGLYGQVS
jgi:hypothetical protein